MRSKYKRQTSLSAWAVVAILACQTAAAANPADVRRAVSKASDAAEFAGHVEDGLKISQTVSLSQNLAGVGNAAERVKDGTQASQAAKRGKDAVESVTASAGSAVGA